MPFNKKQWTSNLHDDAVNAIFTYLDAIAPTLPRDEKMKVAFHGMVYTVANLRSRSHSLPTKDEVESTYGPKESLGLDINSTVAEALDEGERFYDSETSAPYDHEPDYDDQTAIGRSEIHGEALADWKWKIANDIIEHLHDIEDMTREDVRDNVEAELETYRFDNVNIPEEIFEDEHIEEIVAAVSSALLGESTGGDESDLDTDAVLKDALY